MIGWLDQSEEQQRKMREVIALFAEAGTVDDIGIGVVRDAFSDQLFPGLSTVQTRIRYFLFVPWVYQRLETERVRRQSNAEKRAREWELDLMESLMRGGAGDGVIGSVAGRSLKQLPSSVYWSGLRSYGIRTFQGTRRDYFRSMPRIIDAERHHRADGDDPLDAAHGRWHTNLPPAPDDLWESTTLALTAEEARYLQERMATSHPGSLLAHLVRHPRHVPDEVRFPWDAVTDDDLAPDLRQTLLVAQYFSERIHGASLLYNLLLAEASAARGLPRGDLLDDYRAELAEWTSMVDARRPAYLDLDLTTFWSVVDRSHANIPGGARHFVSGWLRAVADDADVTASGELRELIRQRERRLKKSLARLGNPRALESWGGASGTARLTYRWAEASGAVNDLADALG